MKEDNKISRKEAIKIIGEYGKYAAFASLGTFIMLSPQKAQATSVAAGIDPLGSGFDI